MGHCIPSLSFPPGGYVPPRTHPHSLLGDEPPRGMLAQISLGGSRNLFLRTLARDDLLEETCQLLPMLCFAACLLAQQLHLRSIWAGSRAIKLTQVSEFRTGCVHHWGSRGPAALATPGATCGGKAIPDQGLPPNYTRPLPTLASRCILGRLIFYCGCPCVFFLVWICFRLFSAYPVRMCMRVDPREIGPPCVFDANICLAIPRRKRGYRHGGRKGGGFTKHLSLACANICL